MRWRDYLPRFDFSEGLSTRQYRVLFVIGLILGAAVIPNVSALMALFSSSYDVSGGVTYNAADGPAVNVTGSASVESGNPFADNETVALNTSEGNITFSSPAQTNVTIAASEINGTWTNVTSLDVSAANLTIDPEDKEQIVVGGDADSLSYRSMTVGDGQTDFVYAGASGTTTLKLYGLPANTRVGLYDPQLNEILAGGRTDGSGVLVVETPNSEHSVQLVESEGDPEFDTESASPTGDQSTVADELSINVSDPDFPEDSVDVTFYLDGSSVGTDTLNDSGTASVTVDQNLSSGSHEWYAVAEDSFEQETTSPTFEFGVPDELRFYNESDPQELLNNTTIEATIYAGDEVFNRTTTDGTINLSGLPANERLVITADADGFHSQHVVINSLAEQHRVYLLPDENVSTVEVRFKLDDQTGQYPPDSTVLYVQKPISRNGSTTYETIAADEVTQTGFVTELEKDVRYRLIIENEDGDRRILTSYTASVTETATFTVDDINVGISPPEGGYKWGAKHQNQSEGSFVTFSYNDSEDLTKNLEVTVYERGNETNEIHSQTYDGPHGEFSVSIPVPDEHEGATWVVEWEASRDGEKVNAKRVVGPNSGDFGMPLDPQWMMVGSLGLLVVFGGMFGGVRASLGVGVVGVIGGFFWYIRWLPSEVGAGAVVLVLAIAAFYTVSSGRSV